MRAVRVYHGLPLALEIGGAAVLAPIRTTGPIISLMLWSLGIMVALTVFAVVAALIAVAVVLAIVAIIGVIVAAAITALVNVARGRTDAP